MKVVQSSPSAHVSTEVNDLRHLRETRMGGSRDSLEELATRCLVTESLPSLK